MRFERDTTRKDWYVTRIMDFLNDPSLTSMNIKLYPSEATRIARDFAGELIISIGNRVAGDNRHSCTIKKYQK